MLLRPPFREARNSATVRSQRGTSNQLSLRRWRNRPRKWPTARLRKRAKEESLKKRVAVGLVLIALLGATMPAAAFRPLPLSPEAQKALRANFALCNSKLKGPYTENFCVCPGGAKLSVTGPGGQIRNPCKDPLFCAAFRAPWAEALAKERMYIANIFSRDLYLWDSFPDHTDLVRGYVLEKYFTETNPNHKLSQL